MAESALQRLLRLKKEKENAGSTQSVQQVSETSPLETVQGQGSEVGSGSETSGESDNSTQREQLLPTEAIQLGEETEVLADAKLSPDSKFEPVLDVAVTEVIPEVVVPVVTEQVPQKPMSAMERLRALKSGGAKPNGDSGNNESASSSSPVVSPSVNRVEVKPEEVAKIIKERKTHPIAMEMAELEQALNTQVPGFVSILSTIHKKLRADPDVVTLLDDEEIAVIVAGLEKHTNVTIVAPSAIKAARSKARKEPVSAMDL